MRIELKQDGGFAYLPGLARPQAIDTEKLPRDQAVELERLVADAGFFSLPSQSVAPAPGAADYRKYTLTVEDAGRQHTVQFADTDPNPALRALVNAVKSKAS
jgi:uncharacterized protein with von Willebrand factor type A (vWA) domain